VVFHGQPRASREVLARVHESPPVMMVPLYVLAAGALFAGWVFKDWFIGEAEAEFWGASIYRAAHNEIIHHMHAVPAWVKFSPLVMMVIGFVIAAVFYLVKTDLPGRLATALRPLYLFLLNKWYFDELYDVLFVRSAFALGRLFWRADKAVIDGLGPDGVSALALKVGRIASRLQSGYLYHYAFAMLLGIAGLITWLMMGS